MNAERHLKSPPKEQAAKPEIISFPKKPTLRELLNSDEVYHNASRASKEEKPLFASPLSLHTDEVPATPISIKELPPALPEEPISHSDNPIQSKPPEVSQPIEPPPLECDTAPAPALVSASPAYRQFIRWEDIYLPPAHDWHNVRVACMLAIMGCAFTGLVCSILIFAFLE